jgi:hypothetical protein
MKKLINIDVRSFNKPTTILALSLGIFGVSSALAQQDIVSFTATVPGNIYNSSFSWTLGYEFIVTSPITVSGLSAFTLNPGAGLNENTPVGLWDSSQTLLASATVQAGTTDPLTTDGFFRYASIAPLTLQPGTYIVGAEYQAGVDSYTWDTTGFTTLTGVSFVQDRYNQGATLAFPGSTVGTYQNGFFGGNVVVSVPEPTTLALAGLGGLAALVAIRRWK